MPLRFDIKRKLSARSDRVKALDMHPTEPWLLVSLYSGHLHIWNHETQSLAKTIEVTSNDLPIRTAKFVERKSWVVCGSDDMLVRVYNYNTMDKVNSFEAHADYIRCIAVHPTQSYILTCSDDMMIKLWDWNKAWQCTQTFEGHTHYVMQVVFNPKDNNTFASASLDKTIRVWQLGSTAPNFTLNGHEKGVNCLDYYRGADKPYLISGADDFVAKIWDYQNKACVQTLVGHTQNVTCVCFHSDMPIIITGSEDGTIRLWHANTYRLEFTLNYGFERVWCISQLPGSNNLGIGYDEGTIMIKLGREEPAITMDTGGKIIWAKHSEIQQANIKALGDSEVKDGEILPLAVKDMGSCEIFPQDLKHNPNGRFVVVCGDGEYIIYTALAWRNKSFGTAEEFVWAADSSMYCIREGNSKVKIFKNFKEVSDFKPDYGVDGIFGGHLLGVRSASGLTFFNFDTSSLVRRIEVTPKQVFWSDNGELLCIATEEEFYILRYDAEKAVGEVPDEDGFEDAFDVIGEITDKVATGVWVGDCFIYTNAENRLNYFVGGEIVTISHLDRTQYILGYIAKDSKLYLGDKDLNITSFELQTAVLEYQTAVMRQDFTSADEILPTIGDEHRTRVAQFLEKQGFKEQAMAVSIDPSHKFELALQLNDFATAYTLAQTSSSEQKWKQLSEMALRNSEFALAQKCMYQANDYSGLLLLASSLGDADSMKQLAELARSKGKHNIAFTAYMMLNDIGTSLELLVETERFPEAALMAKTYMPSQVSRIMKLWQEDLSKTNKKAAEALADPLEYENLFPELQLALKAEKVLERERNTLLPANQYPDTTPNWERDVLAETENILATMPDIVSSPKTEEMVTKEEKEDQPLAPGVDNERSQSPVRPVTPQQKDEPVPDDPFVLASQPPQAPPQEPAADDPFGFGVSPAPQETENLGSTEEIEDIFSVPIAPTSAPYEDLLVPETAEPEILKPEILKPEILEPEILEPEILEPEILEPEIPVPDPEIPVPDPEIPVQDPEIAVQDPKIPAVETSEPSIPEPSGQVWDEWDSDENDQFGLGEAGTASEQQNDMDDLLGLGVAASQPSSSTTPLDIFGGSSTDFLDMADMDSEISKLNLDDINVDDIDLDDEKLFD